MNYLELFRSNTNHMSENFEISINDKPEVLLDILGNISAYSKRACNLDQELVKEVIYDLYSAIHLSLMGLYRHAFISLRCALEMGVALFQFHDDHIYYLKWKNNNEDISWSSFLNSGRGVLSTEYLLLFRARTTGYDRLILEAVTVYRECSEYVHGKYSYLSEFLEKRISHSKDSNSHFLRTCLQITKILNCITVIRFGNTADEHHDLFEEIIKEFEV